MSRTAGAATVADPNPGSIENRVSFAARRLTDLATDRHVDVRIYAGQSASSLDALGVLCCSPAQAQALVDLFGEV